MASLFENSDEERTETASAYRREEFRRQGTVAVSREILSAAVLLAGGWTLYGAGHWMYSHFSQLVQVCFAYTGRGILGKTEVLELRKVLWAAIAGMAGPLFAVTAAAGFLGGVAQVGLFVTAEPLTPKWERLDPWANFMRLFSAQGAVEAVKAVIKMAVVAALLGLYVKTHAAVGGQLFGKTVSEIATLTQHEVFTLSLWLVGALIVIAALDYGYQKYRHEGQLKMTKREAKDEFKLREGDPLIKARIRSIQKRVAGRRMMENVQESDVVVTNPTHLAVALKYDVASMTAPKVTAKGAGVIAEKIREQARKHHVPLVENKPLARALYQQLDVGESVPKDLYKAVAEVLAYVYRLRRVQSNTFASGATGATA